MAATIRDVARASGVHVSTVSRAFSAPNLVNQHTRTHVLAVAAELGYRPARITRSLVSPRPASLGLIVADLDDPFFPPFIKAAQRQARMGQHRIFVADADSSAAVEQDLVHSLVGGLDGILLCSPYLDDLSIAELARHVPVVVVNRTVVGIPAVVADVADGVRQAVEYLADLGHRNLAYVGGPRGSWTDREIRRAAAVAATARGVDLTVLGPLAPNQSGGAAAAEAIRPAAVTGVLACNDLVAVGLVEALRAAGTDVPGDVSVIGIDDTALAGHVGLTTVATPASSAGRAAVDLLLYQAEADRDGSGDDRCDTANPAVTRVVLPTTLIPRYSTGPRPVRSPA